MLVLVLYSWCMGASLLVESKVMRRFDVVYVGWYVGMIRGFDSMYWVSFSVIRLKLIVWIENFSLIPLYNKSAVNGDLDNSALSDPKFLCNHLQLRPFVALASSESYPRLRCRPVESSHPFLSFFAFFFFFNPEPTLSIHSSLSFARFGR